METWELAAREQIRDLIARYSHCADRGRFRDLVMLFEEEGTLLIAGRAPVRGRLSIEAFLESIRSSGSEPRRRQHHVSNVLIDVIDPATAAAASYFQVVASDGLDHWGTYRDRFVCRQERWLFSERQVRVHSTRR